MTDRENDRRHAIALFRYGLIADLAHTAGAKGLYRRLQEKATADYTIPGSTRTRIAPETLRDWLKRYRQGGFEALMPRCPSPVPIAGARGPYPTGWLSGCSA